MRVAYADPPYYGFGFEIYGGLHSEAGKWDFKSTHLALVARLVDEWPDGWALSCLPRDLVWVLPACPHDVRISPYLQKSGPARNSPTQYRWEPVVWRSSRITTQRLHVSDWVLSTPTGGALGLTGAKSRLFCEAVLDWLVFAEGDVLDDLFPGSGGMSRAAERRGGTVGDKVA